MLSTSELFLISAAKTRFQAYSVRYDGELTCCASVQILHGLTPSCLTSDCQLSRSPVLDRWSTTPTSFYRRQHLWRAVPWTHCRHGDKLYSSRTAFFCTVCLLLCDVKTLLLVQADSDNFIKTHLFQLSENPGCMSGFLARVEMFYLLT